MGHLGRDRMSFFFSDAFCTPTLGTFSLILGPKSRQSHHHYSKEGPRCIPKPTTNLQKSRPGPQSVLWGVPGDPWITKMVPQGAKMEPPGLPNSRFGYQKPPYPALRQYCQSCTSCQSSVHWLAEGPAAGGAALKYIYIYMFNIILI